MFCIHRVIYLMCLYCKKIASQNIGHRSKGRAIFMKKLISFLSEIVWVIICFWVIRGNDNKNIPLEVLNDT